VLNTYWISSAIVYTFLAFQCLVYAFFPKGIPPTKTDDINEKICAAIAQISFVVIYFFHWSVIFVYIYAYAGLIKILN
jgi:hypothetical protein